MNGRSARPGDLQPSRKLPVPRLTPDLLALIRTGEILSLSVVYTPGIPAPGPLAPVMASSPTRARAALGLAVGAPGLVSAVRVETP